MSTEAMKLALYALEWADNAEIEGEPIQVSIQAALTALRQAIAQPAQNEAETLKELIRAVHKAKGRYHTQLATCNLFDAVGLPNERPTK